MRPMTLEEVINALAVDFRESPLRFNPEKTVNGAVPFVKEYLTDPKRSSHVLQAEISDYAGHYMIARTCIAYLCSFDDYDKLKSSPLAVYAAQNWHHHVNRYNLGSLESPHNNGFQLQTPRDHRNDFLALLWVFWIPLGLIIWLFQGIYDSSQQRDSRELIIALMELLDAGSLQYTYMLRLRAMPDPMRRSRRFSTPDDVPPLTLCAHLGVLPAVHQLLEKGADVNAQGEKYGNALYAASDGGHTEIVRALLEKGADVNAQGGWYGNAVQVLLSGEHTGIVRALYAASSGGHAEIVRALLEKGADVNAQGGRYGNALQAASSGRHAKIVRTLLEKGADVNAQGGEYGNALQAASDRGHAEIVRALLEKGADVNAQGGVRQRAAGSGTLR
ncbi:ankyrin repeat-containing domain protein [Mycena olivaceomarginata]|nr:ankyrin repeat-containing domain protein [Mycena olivaceomarginata]